MHTSNTGPDILPSVESRVGAIEDAILASRRAHAQADRDTMFYAAGLIAGALATLLIMRYATR